MKEMFTSTTNEATSLPTSSAEELAQKTLLFNGQTLEQTTACKLADKDGYSLLLLLVNLRASDQKRPYIVAVKNDHADILLKKSSIQVSDFEQSAIIDLFRHTHEVSEKAIHQAKEQFFLHFTTNEKMKKIDYGI